MDAEDETKELLAHDGKKCSVQMPVWRVPLTTTVTINFQDGYETRAFVYELEEVQDGE
jgi:hypothetical protein